MSARRLLNPLQAPHISRTFFQSLSGCSSRNKASVRRHYTPTGLSAVNLSRSPLQLNKTFSKGARTVSHIFLDALLDRASRSSVKEALLSALLSAAVRGQQVGTLQTETHPSLPSKKCTKSGGCTTVDTSVTLDSNWRWTHKTSDSTNCYTGNTWDTTICTDGATCAKTCALEGADYSGTYGVKASGNALTLGFVTKHQYGTNIGSRLYLMASESKYQMFKLLNQEFTFDVDVSGLPCGLNGALYLVEMDEDGGMAKYTNNKAGAKYGTGYCDTQCPHDIKFIAGEANVANWTASSNDVNAGTGKYGACCNEMDIWEANSVSAAFTPHVCSKNGLYRCSGTECGDGSNRYGGVCDKDGCDFNSYRQGNLTFYGKGMIVDTSKPFTVVTQFITTDGTSSGSLKEIRRKYVQNGKVIENSINNVANVPATGAVSDDFCKAQKIAFGDTNSFNNLGGMVQMGGALSRGMVLALSIWDDHAVNMLWLDSTYPTDADPSKPGIVRGTCSTTSGAPTDVEANSPGASVVYSNIRFGDLDSTYTDPNIIITTTNTKTSTSTRSSSTSSSRTSTSSNSSGTVQKWGQCGGIGYSGATTCVSGSTCTKLNDWYYQCL